MSHAADREGEAPHRADRVGAEGQLTGRRRRAEPSSARPSPRLRPTLEVFSATDGKLYLMDAGGVDAEAVVHGAGAAERELLEALAGDGPGPWAVAARHPELDAEALIEELRRLGLLAAGEPEPPHERYARQLLYFGDAAPGADPAVGQARLAASRVVVLGCGGLGSWALCGLACAGVGSLRLVDDDRVELSNLNRQLLYTVADLGRRKVSCCADVLRRFNPEIEVSTVERRVRGPADVAALLDGADLLIEAADWPPYDIARWVDAACREAGVPHLSGGQVLPTVRVGPLVVPGRTACHTCMETAARRDFPLYDELEASRRARGPRPAATLGPASGLIGSMLAMEAVHWLTGLVEPATLGASVAIDLATLAIRRDPIRRLPDCPACRG